MPGTRKSGKVSVLEKHRKKGSMLEKEGKHGGWEGNNGEQDSGKRCVIVLKRSEYLLCSLSL